MVIRKLTSKLLQNIEDYAEDQYTLEDILSKLGIDKSLMNDEQVIQAFNKGQTKLFITLISQGLSNDEIIESLQISSDQYVLWHKTYSLEIEQAKQKIIDDKKISTRQFSNPLTSGMINILEQNGKDPSSISQQVLHNDIKKMVEKIQTGDTKAQITILTTNILQLQLFNSTVTRNLMGETGKQLENFKILSDMQLKVMQETRKSIMAINEITNPKRTTFIKEANQHNHLHQSSEKKYENKNELQKLENSGQVTTDVDLIEKKELFHDKK